MKLPWLQYTLQLIVMYHSAKCIPDPNSGDITLIVNSTDIS